MNVIFYLANGVVPEKGGISRITANLCDLFRRRGVDVWYVGAKDIFENVVYDKNQLFLPDSGRVHSKNNLDYLCQVVFEKKVDFIINQNASKTDHVDLLCQCGVKTGAKVIYCFHNSILTPVYNYAYTRQFPSLVNGKLWYFKLLNSFLGRKFTLWSYIAKYRNNYRNIIKKNDGVVVLCEGQVAELQHASGIKQLPNIHVIYNCMAMQHVEQRMRKKHVLWVGNFDYHIKRPDNMLRIWQKVEPQFPEWTLFMLGSGDSLSCCKKMAEDMGLRNVVFTGRVKPQEYYQEAEILCTTSIHECFPMVLLEGMNYELALMGFNSFTSAELLVTEKENGKLAQPFDIDQYAKTLSELMSDDAERSKMRYNSKTAVNRFTEDMVFEMWEKLFKEIKKQA